MGFLGVGNICVYNGKGGEMVNGVTQNAVDGAL